MVAGSIQGSTKIFADVQILETLKRERLDVSEKGIFEKLIARPLYHSNSVLEGLEQMHSV